MDLTPDAIEPPPAFGSRVRVEYLVGMGKVDARKFVLILDIDRLLGDVAMPVAAVAVPAVA
jgi:purine-binding chemotaxis protein CheW